MSEDKITAPPQETPADNAASPADQIDQDKTISWTASEFIAHHKTAGWYLNLAVVAIVLSGLIYLITRDRVSVGVVVIGAIFMGIYAVRKPRQLQYQVDRAGLIINGKRHGYDEYKSFSIVMDGAFPSLVFMPLRRFATYTTIYYAPEDEAGILAILTDHLPHEEPRRDMVENLMRRIRF